MSNTDNELGLEQNLHLGVEESSLSDDVDREEGSAAGGSAMDGDIEKVLMSAEEIQARVEELGRRISEDYAGDEIFAVGILKGATIFYADLVRAISVPVLFDFMIASSYAGGTSPTGTVKILKDLDYDIAGKHVILVEDVVDTGLTLKYLIKMLQDRHPASIKICAMLSKPSRRLTELHVDYLGCEMPDEFLVGYGLDYAEKYRNLPYIGMLKPSVYE